MPAKDHLNPDQLRHLANKEKSILKEVLNSGTLDYAKTVHNAVHGNGEYTDILDESPDLESVSFKNVRAVSAEIHRRAGESLANAGFPEEFSVWRTSQGGDKGVVSVTTKKGGLQSLFGNLTEYRVKRSDVLTHGEGLLGNKQTFAEYELHVSFDKLLP